MNNRIASLDGIRGLAILLVVLFHYLNNPLSVSHNLSLFGKLVENLTYMGWVGVDLFFVLSGFLIGGILLTNRNSRNYFSTFYIRRALRILPPYLLLLSAFYILNFFIGSQEYYMFQNPFPAWSYFIFTQNFFMGIYGHFGAEGLTPTWSLAIEEQFYLLCPLLIWFVNPKHLPWYLLIFIVISIISRYFSTNWYQSYVWFHSRLDSISIGVLLAWFVKYRQDFLLFHKKKLKWILIIGIIITFFVEAKFGSLGIIKHTIFAFIFGILILHVYIFPESLITSIFKTRMMLFLGGISYSLYLFHNLINGVLHQVLLNNYRPLLNNRVDLLVSIAAISISILLSVILKNIVEQPAIMFGKKRKY